MENRFWTIPPMWDGETVFIIGGGPSLTGFDAGSLIDRRVIAVNCAYRLGQFDMMFFGDYRFPEYFGEGLEKFGGLKVTVREEYFNMPGTRVVTRQTDAYGLSRKPNVLHFNKSSGACAINLATLLGAKKIILLGFDMHPVDGQDNYHKHYWMKDGSHAAVGDYAVMATRFPAIARDLAEMKIECLNACPTSSLDCFPKITIEEALAC